MFVRQVAVDGEGWMVLAIDNYDYGKVLKASDQSDILVRLKCLY